MSAAQQLSGMELDQAVTRVKYLSAVSLTDGRSGWIVYSDGIRVSGAYRAEYDAWADAARSVLDLSGYEFCDNREWFFWRNGERFGEQVASQDLSMDSAKRDYLAHACASGRMKVFDFEEMRQQFKRDVGPALTMLGGSVEKGEIGASLRDVQTIGGGLNDSHDTVRLIIDLRVELVQSDRALTPGESARRPRN